MVDKANFNGVKPVKRIKDSLENVDNTGCALLWLAVFVQALKDKDFDYFESELFEQQLSLLPEIEEAPHFNNVEWWREKVKEEGGEWLNISKMT